MSLCLWLSRSVLNKCLTFQSTQDGHKVRHINTTLGTWPHHHITYTANVPVSPTHLDAKAKHWLTIQTESMTTKINFHCSTKRSIEYFWICCSIFTSSSQRQEQRLCHTIGFVWVADFLIETRTQIMMWKKDMMQKSHGTDKQLRCIEPSGTHLVRWILWQ